MRMTAGDTVRLPWQHTCHAPRGRPIAESVSEVPCLTSLQMAFAFQASSPEVVSMILVL